MDGGRRCHAADDRHGRLPATPRVRPVGRLLHDRHHGVGRGVRRSTRPGCRRPHLRQFPHRGWHHDAGRVVRARHVGHRRDGPRSRLPDPAHHEKDRNAQGSLHRLRRRPHRATGSPRAPGGRQAVRGGGEGGRPGRGPARGVRRCAHRRSRCDARRVLDRGQDRHRGGPRDVPERRHGQSLRVPERPRPAARTHDRGPSVQRTDAAEAVRRRGGPRRQPESHRRDAHGRDAAAAAGGELPGRGHPQRGARPQAGGSARAAGFSASRIIRSPKPGSRARPA